MSFFKPQQDAVKQEKGKNLADLNLDLDDVDALILPEDEDKIDEEKKEPI